MQLLLVLSVCSVLVASMPPARCRLRTNTTTATVPQRRKDFGRMKAGAVHPPKDLTLKGNPCGNGLTFCEEVEGYDELVKRFRIDDNIKEFSFVDGYETDSDIIQRFGPSGSSQPGIPFCDSMRKLQKPKAAESEDGTWLYMYQTPEFTQEIWVEMCISDNQDCHEFNDFASCLRGGRRTRCVQHYVYRHVLTITGEHVRVKMPSCCKCLVFEPESHP